MALPKVDWELISQASNELEGESDRAAAIVGASLLEHLLELILRKAMINHKEVKTLFRAAYAPFATFQSKIDATFLLGLFPHEKIRDDLHRIREIRNIFAHGHKELSFSDESTKSSIGKFHILGLYRKSLKLHEEQVDKFDEQHRKFYEKSKSPRKMWEVAIYSIADLLSSYEDMIVKPTIKEKRKITIAGVEEEWNKL
jgi:hypothetical protein